MAAPDDDPPSPALKPLRVLLGVLGAILLVTAILVGMASCRYAGMY